MKQTIAKNETAFVSTLFLMYTCKRIVSSSAKLLVHVCLFTSSNQLCNIHVAKKGLFLSLRLHVAFAEKGPTCKGYADHEKQKCRKHPFAVFRSGMFIQITDQTPQFL